jgi:hypothetical protein
VPPVKVLVQEKEEVGNGQENTENQGEDSNGDQSTLNWEATQAGVTIGFAVGAYANTAATVGLDWGNSI